ncbi:hypothetical protein KTH_45700 [Thermosporothrix hazakensis]|uniref:Uncharacterized protein n=1 Tax=Thermosporothrix sp. COM3 TaxID=2490863 RepID=A0A455SZK3_9CHLR|nr:hypothetical protein KTC_63060 [Thermosporothrix sp. COM3]GCE49701.1 hypothetical protein KTH_45700 [Thermosporothrix hazakensis]
MCTSIGGILLFLNKSDVKKMEAGGKSAVWLHIPPASLESVGKYVRISKL